MKSYLLPFALLFMMNAAFAQSKETKVAYHHTQQPAAVIDLPYSSGVVETAIENYLSAKGAKGKDLRGFKTYKNVNMGDSTSDLYFKVERKSQGESTVYLFVSPANQDVLTRNAESMEGVEQAKEVLNSLTPSAEASSLDVKLKEQEDIVNKAEKKLHNLMEDASDLTKRKAEIEQKIIENQRAQERQKAEIEKTKTATNTFTG